MRYRLHTTTNVVVFQNTTTLSYGIFATKNQFSSHPHNSAAKKIKTKNIKTKQKQNTKIFQAKKMSTNFMLLRNGKRKYNSDSTNFMLLRNGKRKYNILRTNQNDNNSFKNFYGIKIFDKDYYICGIQPFNSNELKQLITINCTAREKQSIEKQDEKDICIQ